MNQPLISIIIPVYNSEKYIEKCVQSIISQNYAHFECIIIDDGSIDNSFQICSQIAEKDRRIKIILTKNQGVSHARNIGIEQAQGEWITFIDSDDFIDKNHLGSFIPYLDSHAFYAQTNLRKIFPNDITQIIGIQGLLDFANLSETEKAILLNKNHLLFASSCGKLFSTSIIQKNNLRFNEKYSSGEDRIFNGSYLLLDDVKRIIFVNECCYNYVIHKGSLTTTALNLQMWYDMTTEWHALLQRINEKFKIEDKEVINSQNRFIKNQYIDNVLWLFADSSKSFKQKAFLYSQIKKSIVNMPSESHASNDYKRLEKIISIWPAIIGSIFFHIHSILKK